MHKITKGLKKKKKGKKSKHKEEELFKPEELEAYRKEHQAHLEAGGAENEEWKKFHALTSGVDDILQKTQEELSRIKETSFFQRVATESEVKREEQRIREEEQRVREEEVAQKELAQSQEPDPVQLGIVEVSESESEGDAEEDDIFDTAYIDALAAADIKLAYIPESPTEEAGDDPFDTSYAEKAILGPAVSRKGKKLVPIGSAVEVLTGRVQLPTCSTQRPVPNKRQIFKERDLLLGSFDDNANSIAECIKDSPDLVPKTLLDEDAPSDLSNEPIDLSKSLYIPPPPPVTPSPLSDAEGLKPRDLEDFEYDEFAQLAAENLNKEPVNKIENLPPITPVVAEVIEENWGAFVNENIQFQANFNNPEEPETEVDPFDTTFAANILPGKAELKQIESEILNAQVEFEVKPQQDKLLHILKKLSISEEDSKDRIPDTNPNIIKPEHRDLLGGSNTDLSSLNRPLTPAAQIDENYIEYGDPFDTSIVETVKKPGQTELKFLEKELLSDIRLNSSADLSDDDFNPRATEEQISRERTVSRPDVLNITGSKSVCFDASSLKDKDYIDIAPSISKLGKPPTPFYARKNSVPGAVEEDISPDLNDSNLDEDDIFGNSTQDSFNTFNSTSNNIVASGSIELNDIEDDFDPFDTSIANTIIPGTL